MEYIGLDLYGDFQCMAGACPSTCCAGWKIVVDYKDYRRFQEMEKLEVRQKILDGIAHGNGTYAFKNRKDGTCVMLEQDGLCYIQKETDEKTLCNTCRKYPRIMTKREGCVWLSMAASCPVVAAYIVKGKIGWTGMEKGKCCQCGTQSLPFLKSCHEVCAEWKKIAEEYSGQRSNVSVLYDCFTKMADSLMDTVAAYGELRFLLPYFSCLEKEKYAMEKTVEFCGKFNLVWKKICDSYVQYGIFTRKIEFWQESSYENVRQILGETFVIRLLAFCAYLKKGELGEEEWEKAIWDMYRLCAHGKEIAKRVHQTFQTFFSNDALWYYILL